MANSVLYKEAKLAVGDMLDVNYRIKEGDKERLQMFTGILLKIRGEAEQGKMITVRKISKSGIGIERIIPLNSPFVESIKVTKQSENTRSKIYFVRKLSDQQLRSKLYRKKLVKKSIKTAPVKQSSKRAPASKKSVKNEVKK